MITVKIEDWFKYFCEHKTFTGCLIDSKNNKYCFLEGMWHKEDGPAIEYANGDKQYYLNEKHYTEETWRKEVRRRKLEKILSKINDY